MNKVGIGLIGLGNWGQVELSALSTLPHVVVVAVGADPLVPEIPGIEKEKVLTVIQLFEDKKLTIGDRSVKVVDVLDRDTILQDEHPANRSMLIRSMEKEGVKILEKREIVRIEEEGVVRREDGTEELLPADNIVLATGFRPKTNLRNALSEVSFNAEIHFIGDCVEPRKLYEAIHEGYYVGWKI